MNKNLIIAQNAVFVLCILFSLLNIHIVPDISVFAFFITAAFTAVLVYIGFFRVQRKIDAGKLSMLRKLYQYLPFVMLCGFVIRRAGHNGTSRLFDICSIIVWLLLSAVDIAVSYQLDAKRVFLHNAQLKNAYGALPERHIHPAKKLICEIFEWIDAFVQAAFTVTLINIFIFQLYEIPSESMVPEFLIKDRVVVLKTPSGPRFPLADVGLPCLKHYERGDIVVFRNPHYSKDRPSEVKTFLSQLVYMLSFTTVNLNVDSGGQLKADPLVKRIAGMPGEQLMMQDGILYARTEKDAQFVPVRDDALWAEWNLGGLPEKTADSVRDIPVSAAQYRQMLEVEKMRNEFDLLSAERESAELAERFSQICETPDAPPGTDISALFSKGEMFEYALFAQNDTLTWKLMSVSGGKEWFANFMTDWRQHKLPPESSLYDEANFRLNVLIKLCLGRLVVRNAELSKQNASVSSADPVRLSLFKEAEKLNLYVILLDRRNMPVFPQNDAAGNPVYIPDACYFMMGDNRFNSLDMRHSYEEKLVQLCPADPYSVTYYSNMAPQYVPAKDILGVTALRFWPMQRFGIPGRSAKK